MLQGCGSGRLKLALYRDQVKMIFQKSTPEYSWKAPCLSNWCEAYSLVFSPRNLSAGVMSKGRREQEWSQLDTTTTTMMNLGRLRTGKLGMYSHGMLELVATTEQQQYYLSIKAVKLKNIRDWPWAQCPFTFIPKHQQIMLALILVHLQTHILFCSLACSQGPCCPEAEFTRTSSLFPDCSSA